MVRSHSLKTKAQTAIHTFHRLKMKVTSPQYNYPAGYHDPFLTPNLLRKNEVAVYVDPTSASTMKPTTP